MVTFPVELPAHTSAEQLAQWLLASGFTKIQAERDVEGVTARRRAAPPAGALPGSVGAVKILDVVADRFIIGTVEGARHRGD